jgi:S-adenosyl methyltransferase
MTEAQQVPPGVDPHRPAPARIYDYFLQGTSSFPVDRVAAERITQLVPEIKDCAWSNRGFHQRAAKWIAERGVRQFIDIGSGLPTVGNTHEVVRRVAPESRVVYVDNDPMVQAYGEVLLADTETTSFVHGDLRDPDTVLGDPGLRRLIDFRQPTGLLMTAVVHFVADSSNPRGLIRRYVDALAPGSYLALSHLSDDHKPPRTVEGFLAVFEQATEQLYFRSKSEMELFFDGLEMVPPYDGAEPGICYTGIWGAEDPVVADSDGARWLWCGVARCP